MSTLATTRFIFPTEEETLCNLLPAKDHETFLSLKVKYKDSVRHKVHAMACIETLLENGFTQKAAIREVLKRKRGIKGLSASMLTKMYPIWRDGGQKQNPEGKPAGAIYAARSWKLFAPNYKNGNDGQPAEFVEWLKSIHIDTTRDDAFQATRARLLDLWRGGSVIPGYGTIHDWCEENNRRVPTSILLRPSDYPSGWSVSNLRRYIESGKAKIELLRKGEYQAHKHWSDQLLRDRSNLMPLQLITFDDVRFDIRVLMYDGNQARPVYPLGLFSLDVATGYILSHGVKAADTRLDDEGASRAGTKRALNQADTRFQLLQLLELYGLPNYKMRILLENATASLTQKDKDAFLGLMPGMIEFEETGMIRNKLLKGGFQQEGGMPWQKGWIESWFRGLHTRINHLPGTVGRRYDLTRGDHAHKERYAVKTLQAALDRGIDPRELRLPILTLDQFKELLAEYVNRINWRTAHKLQGFDRVYEYELNPGEYIRFDDPEQGHLIPVNADLIERMEAPAERFQRLCSEVTFQIPRQEALLPLYLNKKPVKVRNERIQFTDKKFAVGELVYYDRESRLLLSELNGREVYAFIRDDLELVHLTDKDYAYLGSVSRLKTADLANDREMELGYRRVNNSRETVRAEARRIAAPQDQQGRQDQAHNDALLGDRMLEAEKRSSSQRSKQRSLEKKIADAEDVDFPVVGKNILDDENPDLSDYFG